MTSLKHNTDNHSVETAVAPLLKGEQALSNAPHTELFDGMRCIPQHYLTYAHTLESVEELIMNIHYSDNYPIFVSEDHTGIHIQVGVIGYDNYVAKNKQGKAKIVYGRKWRVEPQLPTSEIIQTVFLAIKKAREHEIRELFRFSFNGKSTTPFNNHHDTPLISRGRNCLTADHGFLSSTNRDAMESVLRNIRYDEVAFKLIDLSKRPTGQWLIELEIVKGKNTQLVELSENRFLSYLISNNSLNDFLYGLMNALIQLSDRHVDEHFTFDDVPRFSWTQSVRGIANLSSRTRSLHEFDEQKEFSLLWKQFNYETDLTRVPKLNASKLSKRLQKTMEKFSPLEGVLPILE